MTTSQYFGKRHSKIYLFLLFLVFIRLTWEHGQASNMAFLVIQRKREENGWYMDGKEESSEDK